MVGAAIQGMRVRVNMVGPWVEGHITGACR